MISTSRARRVACGTPKLSFAQCKMEGGNGVYDVFKLAVPEQDGAHNNASAHIGSPA
jgi:hypothetical protein